LIGGTPVGNGWLTRRFIEPSSMQWLNVSQITPLSAAEHRELFIRFVTI
jgi:hypothetical protein